MNNQFTPEGARETEIPAALRDLEQSILIISDHVGTLMTRLQDVLSQSTPSGSQDKDKKGQTATSELGGQIINHRLKLDEATANLRNILDRLEI